MKNFRSILCAFLCVAILMCAFTFALPSAAEETTHEQFSLNTVDFVSGITAGWNLGNTMEAHSTDIVNPTPKQIEIAWTNNTITSQAVIDTVYNAGYNAIRIPITWSTFVTKTDNVYSINTAWIDRIKEIVQYAYNDNMYVIINMHHDDKLWLNIAKEDPEWTAVKDEYQALWQIIATSFKDYDEKLIFEGANEIVWNGDWWGNDTAYFDKINDLYQIFVDTVRASGGNNDKRYLMIPTYGAQWYAHQIDNLKIPNNDNHVIIDIHWYAAQTTDVKTFNTYFSYMYNNYVSKGIAVVIGEYGIRKDADETTKVKWATAYIGTAAACGLRCFIWDDAGNYTVLNRGTLTWVSTKMNDAIMAAAKTPVGPITQTVAETTTTGISNTAATTTKPSIPAYLHNIAGYTINSTVPASNYHVGYSGGWPDGNTITVDNTDGSVYAYAKLADTAVNQIQWYRDLSSGFNQMVTDAKGMSGAKIAIDITSDFTIGTTDTPQCLFRVTFPSLGFTAGDFEVVLKSGETTTVLVDLEYFTKNVTAMNVQFNNYKNFGIAFFNPKFTVSLPYIALVTKGEQETTVSQTETTTNNNVIYGDVNSDKAINSKDSLLLKKYIASWEIAIDTTAADVNVDGSINSKDSLLLKRYVASWDVILGK